jgi:LmbE family N-acetylglucosaminyl deacetylase
VVNPGIEATHPISLLREQELRCACKHFGIKHLHLLGYMDGQTATVPPSEAVYRIVSLLRDLKPQVVLSFGPEGIYGHFDHLVVHRWATAAVELAADEESWPEVGSPHQVDKFYHRAMPQEQVDQMRENSGGRVAVMMDGIPFPFTAYPMEQITTVIDTSDYNQAKFKGIQCYASQINPTMMPYLQDDFDPAANPWFWQETFILAHAREGLQIVPDDASEGPKEKETDLFAGVNKL